MSIARLLNYSSPARMLQDINVPHPLATVGGACPSPNLITEARPAVELQWFCSGVGLTMMFMAIMLRTPKPWSVLALGASLGLFETCEMGP